MSTIALPPTSITADQYASILGKPAHRGQALLQPVGCPTCTGPLRNTGWADWVKEHGIIVTLWTCLNSDCRELRYRNDFRLETAVYPHPEEEPAPAECRTYTALSRITPLDIPAEASLTLQYRVRHPSRKTTREYWTINARGTVEGFSSIRTLGDFGRWAPEDKAKAEAALVEARLDLRTRRITAFTSFAELLDARYNPTLADKVLVEAYNAAQLARGDHHRAYAR